MWIDPAPFSSGVIRSRAPSSDHPTQVTIMICGNMLTLSGPKAIRLESGRIIDVKGAVVARAAASSANTHCYNISHLSTGVYLVSWRESNVEKSRIVTIAR
jgi:nitrous oxidase accessory protein NosD